MKNRNVIGLVTQDAGIKNNSFTPRDAISRQPGDVGVNPNGNLMMETQMQAMRYNSSPMSPRPTSIKMGSSK